MKTRTLPPFPDAPFKRPRSPLSRFIFDQEPEGIKESAAFRRQLLRVLQQLAPFGSRWVDNDTP